MLFQRKVDRAVRLQKEQNEESGREPLPKDKDELDVSKKDEFAMILSAWLTFVPIAILVLAVIAFGCYFLFFH